MRPTSLLPLLFSSLALGSPAPPQYKSLSFTVLDGSTVVSAVLLADPSKQGTYLLRAQRPLIYQGTQAFFTGSSNNGTARGLLFLPNSYTTAGAAAPEVGDDYGYAAPITVTEGSQGDEEWTYEVANGRLYHELHAALEGFFACEVEIGGENATVLSWGVPRDDGTALVAPEGCEYTTVYVGEYVQQ